MQQSPLNKVVLATALECNGLSKSPIDYFKRSYRNTKTLSIILLFHPKYGLWMGATPERLITMQQSHLTQWHWLALDLWAAAHGEKRKRKSRCLL